MLNAWAGNRKRSRLVSDALRRFGKKETLDYGAVADANLRGSRMNVSFDLPDLTADWTPVYHVAERRTTRVDRSQARAAYEKERTVALVGRGGMQGRLFLILTACILTLIFIVVGANAGDIRAASRRIKSIESRIADVDRQCDALREQYDAKAASVDVGYRAVDLGMISSKGVSMVMLYAPDDAVMTPSSANSASAFLIGEARTSP